MKRVMRIGLTAACMAAFSLPALAQQQCAPTDQVLADLEAHGWEMHDAMSVPAGGAVALMCNGTVGGLVAMSTNGISCLIGQPIAGLCRVPGTES